MRDTEDQHEDDHHKGEDEHECSTREDGRCRGALALVGHFPQMRELVHSSADLVVNEAFVPRAIAGLIVLHVSHRRVHGTRTSSPPAPNSTTRQQESNDQATTPARKDYAIDAMGRAGD